MVSSRPSPAPLPLQRVLGNRLHRALVNFFRQYKTVFAIRSSQYADDEVKVQLARSDLKGESMEAWYEREENEGGESSTTWQELKEFFEEQLDPTTTRTEKGAKPLCVIRASPSLTLELDLIL